MTAAAAFDAQEFRRALGMFATGVTIITTRSPSGEPVGLTVNSFSSVSLNPPLVLWSLDNGSRNLPAFRDSPHWAVHVLGTDQEALSARFARRGEDKFAGLDYDRGPDQVPLLRGCSARFECRTVSQYQGGDHLIFIGEVIGFERRDTAPLVFHGGRYAHATRRDPADQRAPSAWLSGSFGADFLGYLLGRSHFRFYAQIRPLLAEAGLGDEEFYVLSALTLKQRLGEQDLATGMAGVLDDGSRRAMDALIARGLAHRVQAGDESCYELSDSGREAALRLIAAATAVESRVLGELGSGDGQVLKSLLGRLLAVIDPGGAALWEAPDQGRPP